MTFWFSSFDIDCISADAMENAYWKNKVQCWKRSFMHCIAASSEWKKKPTLNFEVWKCRMYEVTVSQNKVNSESLKQFIYKMLQFSNLNVCNVGAFSKEPKCAEKNATLVTLHGHDLWMINHNRPSKEGIWKKKVQLKNLLGSRFVNKTTPPKNINFS